MSGHVRPARKDRVQARFCREEPETGRVSAGATWDHPPVPVEAETNIEITQGGAKS